MADDPGYISLFAALNSLLHEGTHDWLLHPEWIDVFVALTPAEMVALYGPGGGPFVPYSGATANVDLGLHSLTVDSPTLFVDATNHRVGVKTITPSQALDVNGNVLVESAPDGAAFVLGTVASPSVLRWIIRNSGAESGGNTGSDLAFVARTDAGGTLSTPFYISRGTGYVGIGTLTPGITGNTRTLTISTGATPGFASVEFQGNNTSGAGGIGGFDIYNIANRVGVMQYVRDGADNSAAFTVYTANAGALGERFRVDKAGLFGIGATPTTQFSVKEKFQVDLNGLIPKYNNVATAGLGVPAIYGEGRSAGAIAAVTSVAAYTVGAADGTFRISANVNVTTATAHSFSVLCTYTDETNTSRVLTLPFVQLGGITLVGTITNLTGAGPYEGISLTIRAKASTSITISTSGTFTTIVYNVEGVIEQVA